MKKKIKKVLVTGGAGCIGIQVTKSLLKKKIIPIVYDLKEQIDRNKKDLGNCILYKGSINEENKLKKAVDKCDAVIHLAAYLGVKRTEKNKIKCLNINIDGTRSLLKLISNKKKIKKIIFASSSEVYGEPERNPITEKFQTQGKTIYAISKLAGEEYIKSYCEQYSHLSFTILRYFNTYGPGQVAQFVIPSFIRKVMRGKSPIINGSGNQLRSFCYVEDTAEATVKSLLSHKTKNKIINIGNSNEIINLKDLADLVISICTTKNIKPKFLKEFNNADRKKDREINKRYCSTLLAKKLINFEPKISLSNGIKKIFQNGVPNNDWGLGNEIKYSLDD